VADSVVTTDVDRAFLEVDDHEAALAFYRDALGLEVRQDVGGKVGAARVVRAGGG